MRKIIFLVLPLLLSACNESAGREPIIRNTFEVDGCEVKYVDPSGLPNFYIARCGGTNTVTWQERSGKSTTTRATVNVDSADDLRKRLGEVEARDKALAKLTPEERKALGVK
jgi:hypothetical protein